MKAYTFEYSELKEELTRIAHIEKSDGICFKRIFSLLAEHINFDLADMYISTYDGNRLVCNHALMCSQKFRDGRYQLDNYTKFSRHDFTVPVALANSGCVLSTNDLQGDVFFNSVIYLRHCVKFGLYTIAGVARRIKEMPHSHLFIYFYSHQEQRIFTASELELIQAVCEELFFIFANRFNLWTGARIFSTEQENGALQQNYGYSPEELKLLRIIEKQVAAGACTQDKILADMLHKSTKTVSNQLQSLYRKKLQLSGDKLRLLQEFEKDLTQARYHLQKNILLV